VIQQAAEDEGGWSPEIVCVEPFPTSFLRREHEAGRIVLHSEMAQTVDLDVLTSLGDGGMLFVDSTHTVKPGSEVLRIVLEVMPRLAAGTHVHFHDIYFPYDFTPRFMEDVVFFNRESAFLHAFLINNAQFEISASLSMLHHARQAELKALLPRYKPAPIDRGLRTAPGDFPSATYLRTRAIERTGRHG
ncbi:MAG: class I SAM-dependent methyltransferase, partial [Planctomycetota bacterium]|nr:class I SAM-dependent methyltransferase [Planctomycetota bacterium]